MGDLSEEQQSVLNLIQVFATAIQFDKVGNKDDYDLLRFCRARKFVLQDIKTMMQNHVQWRKDNDVDNIVNFNFYEDKLLQQFYPHSYHGVDK
jgi:hypothetical protein